MATFPEPSEWVDRYGDALYSFAYFQTGDRSEAEDVVQETFLRGIRKLSTFEESSSLKTWLTGILKNVIRERARQKGREIGSLGGDATEVNAMLSIPELQALPPDQVVEKNEFWEAVNTCLESF